MLFTSGWGDVHHASVGAPSTCLQVSLEEPDNGHRRANAVGHLAPAMSFVRKEHVLDGHVALCELLNHLLRFDDRDVRVVGTMQHDRWRLDAVDAVDGREPAQHLGFGLRVAVFDRRDGGHPRLRVPEEGFEVDDAKEIRASGEEVGVR
jgi:hypothetical protein